MGIVLVVFAAMALILAWIKTRNERLAEPIITAAITAHRKALYIKSQQLLTVDPYGNVDYAKFNEHVGYFIAHVIERDMRANRLSTGHLKHKKYVKKILAEITTAIIEEAGKDEVGSMEDVKTGVDYELFCKRLLEADGWTVLTTPATGDQGADLIATKSSVRVVFQCKFYSQPVGNKAVQEAHTAKAFQRADFAVVVSNADYTVAARQLAQSSGVYLIHHTSLSELAKILGCQPAQQDAP